MAKKQKGLGRNSPSSIPSAPRRLHNPGGSSGAGIFRTRMPTQDLHLASHGWMETVVGGPFFDRTAHPPVRSWPGSDLRWTPKARVVTQPLCLCVCVATPYRLSARLWLLWLCPSLALIRSTAKGDGRRPRANHSPSSRAWPWHLVAHHRCPSPQSCLSPVPVSGVSCLALWPAARRTLPTLASRGPTRGRVGPTPVGSRPRSIHEKSGARHCCNLELVPSKPSR